jgi:hypothetical protein
VALVSEARASRDFSPPRLSIAHKLNRALQPQMHHVHSGVSRLAETGAAVYDIGRTRLSQRQPHPSPDHPAEMATAVI